MRRFFLVVLLLLAGCTSGTHASPSMTPSVSSPTAVTSTTSGGGTTGVRARAWPVPSNALTPGNIDAACPATRKVTSKLRTTVRALYHVKKTTGEEEDHRIPKFLCGSDDTACPATQPACPQALANIWPEAADGYMGPKQLNRKDQLEDRVYTKWHSHQMTTEQAIAVFAAPSDWRAAWCALVHKPNDGVDCRPWNSR